MKVNLLKSIFVREKLSHGKDVVVNFDKHNTVAFIRFPDDIFQSSFFSTLIRLASVLSCLSSNPSKLEAIALIRILNFCCLMKWLGSKAYFPLGDFIRATRSENKNPATWLVKISWRKNSPRTSRKRYYFFVCSREQSRQVENRLKICSMISVPSGLVARLCLCKCLACVHADPNVITKRIRPWPLHVSLLH